MAEELKIYIDNPEEIEQKLRSIGANFIEELHIIDTYFDQPGMVLKLTEDQSGAYITQLQAKDGGFQFLKKDEIHNVEETKANLEKQYGVKCVLKKKKRIWGFDKFNVNLNLFEDIGNFLIVEGEKVTPNIFTEIFGLKDPKYLTKSFAQHKAELQPKVILSDLGAVLLFPKDRNYKGKSNPIYNEESKKDSFNFFDHFVLNTELLKCYSRLKDKGHQFYMVTEGTIQNDPAVKSQINNVFIKVFSTGSMGLNKKESNTYELLAREIGVGTNDILYIDDSSENVKAAELAGLKALIFKDNKTAIEDFKNL